MASTAKREAAHVVACVIEDWLVKYSEGKYADVLSAEGRAELVKLRATFATVAATPDPVKPEGWTAGDPAVGVCNCDSCVARKVAAAKAAGRLEDPREETT